MLACWGSDSIDDLDQPMDTSDMLDQVAFEGDGDTSARLNHSKAVRRRQATTQRVPVKLSRAQLKAEEEAAEVIEHLDKLPTSDRETALDGICE